MGLNEDLLNSLHSQGFEQATPVQVETIPVIVDGKDVFALAETGSGKTGSFAIPILELIQRMEDSTAAQFVVLSPTRELAQQTHKVFNDFGKALGIDSACLIGGENIEKQKTELEKNPNIIVGTPGRVVDLIKQKCLKLTDCNGIVFDEADRLFDMGFQKDIEFILKGTPSSRQLIMVSATSNMEVLSTAYKYHSQPVEIKLNEDDLLVDSINHEIAMISKEEKMPYLVNLLRQNDDAYAIIFCNTQFMTHLVATWLEKMGFKVKPISGRMAQNKRTRLMTEFREKKITILACTDVAARGLDIKDINLVVNYDLPNEAANYVHRIGRTGRAGKEGKAVSFCGYEDCENLDAISELIEAKIPKSDIEDSDFATDLCPKPYIDAKTLLEVDRSKGRNKKGSERTNDRTKKAKTNDRPAKQPKAATEKRESRPVIERTFKFTSSNPTAARRAALKHFRIEDDLLLDSKTLSVGKKKFIIFGSRETTYEFKLKAIYKRLLLPFYIDLFKKMKLKIFVKIAYKEPNVRVSFSGKDSGLLVKNKFELQNSIEQISRIYLGKKIAIPSETKISFRTERESKHQLTDADLIKMVEESMAKIEAGEESVKLKSLNPAHRRIIHQHVSENSKFQSNSVGDGRFKQIEITLS